MTLNERLNILKNLEDYAWGSLKDPATPAPTVKDTLDHINYLHWFADGLAERVAVLDGTAPVVTMRIADAALDAEAAAPTREPDVTESGADDVSYSDTKTEAPSSTEHYEKKDVVAMMKEARKQGINVSAIIRAFGVDNFGDIDAEKYPEVVAELKKEGAL